MAYANKKISIEYSNFWSDSNAMLRSVISGNSVTDFDFWFWISFPENAFIGPPLWILFPMPHSKYLDLIFAPYRISII